MSEWSHPWHEAPDRVADRRQFLLDEAGWQAFEEKLGRPAVEVPGLRELLTSPTALNAA